jgi:hypothetical protein
MFIMVIILNLLWCTACQPADVQESTDGEIRETESAGAEEDVPTVTETDTPTEPEPQLAAYDYYIEELDATLMIHESLCVYEIDGIYLDWLGELNTHSFSKWVVVTDKEYDEATLAQLLCENGREEAVHIVFAVAVTPEEFFPARRLCYGLFAETEVRVKDDWYCEVLDTRKTVKTMGRFGDYSAVELGQDTGRWNEWIGQWKEAIEEKAMSTPHLYGQLDAVLRPGGLNIGDESLYAMTFADKEFWEIYLEAVNQLQFSPEDHAYDETVVDTLIRETEEKAAEVLESGGANGTEKPKSVYADSWEDIYIRAYYYAKYVTGKKLAEGQFADTGSVDDFVVILQDWGNDRRSFITYRKEDTGEYLRYGGGYDYFNNLHDSCRYIQEYGVDFGPFTVEIDLPSYPDEFIVYVKNEIRQEDGNFILSGRKLYGGDIVIDYNKKALLDAGARMVFCLDGQEMFTVDSAVKQEDYDAVCYYQDAEEYGYTWNSIVIMPFTESRMGLAEPRAGEFKLAQPSMGRFSLVLEEEFELVVPADTLVYPHDTYNWEYMNKNGFENGLSLDEITPVTMAEFCEKVIDPERCSEHFLIYMEDGVIAKIVEEFSW